MIDKKDLAKIIDHTLLKPNATIDNIIRLCEEAKEYSFWSVCVNPTHVSTAIEALRGTDVRVCTVVGFPLGANIPEVKAFEAKHAIRHGASEIDMVMNIGALKSRNYDLTKEDISTVIKHARATRRDVVVKVIIETGLLTEDEKVLACRFVEKAGADFVKTSTGFNTSGATVPDVRLLRDTLGPRFGVKASGGIGTYQRAIELVRAGANRIGTSSGVAIIEDS